MSYDDIEQDIVNALQHLPDISRTHGYRDTDWTNATKAIFAAIRERNKHNQWPSRSYSNFDGRGRYSSNQIRAHVKEKLGSDFPVPVYEKPHEWLYDIVWWDECDGFVYDIPLVAESEWG